MIYWFDIKFPLTTSVLAIAKSLWNYILLIIEDSKSGKKSEFAAKTSITKYKNSIEDFLKKGNKTYSQQIAEELLTSRQGGKAMCLPQKKNY